MKLLAISDLHVGFPDNRAAVASLGARPDDWLILGGDLGETFDHVRFVLDTLAPRFRRLVWVPGNHELYADPQAPDEPRGEARYARYVELCRERGVLTPEDPYPVWEGEGGPHLVVPMFLLYDYTFRPDDVPVHEAVAWAAEQGIAAADEVLLDPAPHPSRQAWCHARVDATEARLREAPPDLPKVLINHFPLRQDLVFLPRVPRFSPWCGTRKTTDWHLRFHARVVVQGHLHVRRTVHVDGVRFEEVSFGYPRERRRDRPIDDYVKQILPTPEATP